MTITIIQVQIRPFKKVINAKDIVLHTLLFQLCYGVKC